MDYILNGMRKGKGAGAKRLRTRLVYTAIFGFSAAWTTLALWQIVTYRVYDPSPLRNWTFLYFPCVFVLLSIILAAFLQCRGWRRNKIHCHKMAELDREIADIERKAPRH